MTNKKITDLVELTTPTTDDVFPLVDIATNSTKKAQLANLPISTATQTALDAKQATLVSGTNIKTINSTSLLGSGNISIAANPAGTAGQIQFSNGSAFAADSNLFWDNTNKRLGVGTSSPTETIQINGNIFSGGGTKLTLTNESFALQTIVPSGPGGMVVGTNGTVPSFIDLLSGSQFFHFANRASENRLGIYSANFSGSTATYSSELFTFTTTGRLGIGTTTPTAQLQVKGAGSTSATTSLLVQNSSGTNHFMIKDDGQILLYAPTTYLYGTFGSSNANMLIRASDGAASFGAIAPSSSAQLQADSTTKGFLPPRMTTTQKTAISAPASGLQVFDTTTAEQNIYDGSGWRNVIAGDNTNLVWDNTNKRLGIGTNTPGAPLEILSNNSDSQLKIGRGVGFAGSALLFSNSVYGFAVSYQTATIPFVSYRDNKFAINTNDTPTAQLQVKGSGSTSATTSLLVQNSSGTELLKVTDDGKATMSSAKMGSIEIAYATITRATGDQIFFNSNKVIIGSTNTYASSQLSVDSTSAGFLPPRMTTTQKNAISTPAAGLMVYDTDTNKLCCYNGTTWNDLF